MSLPRPPHAGMRHVALNVIDLPLVEKFYVELLGFEVEWRPDAENVYLCSGVDNLALHVAVDIGKPGKQALAHTGIIVDKIEQGLASLAVGFIQRFHKILELILFLFMLTF